MPVFFSRYPSSPRSRDAPPVKGSGIERSGAVRSSFLIRTTVSEMTMKIYSSDKASTAKAPDADSTNLSSKEEIEETLNEMTGELANVILQFMFSEMM